MELYQLKSFITVADEGNLTRAADRLFTSQPAVSAQIKSLEDELGVTLFDRMPKGMSLTPKGEMLYRQAVETVEAANMLKNTASAIQGSLIGEIRFGVNTDFDFLHVGAIQKRFASDHPGISPHFIQSESARILPDIFREKLDAGFFFGKCTVSGLSVTPLGATPMRLVAPIAWKDRVESADLDDLAGLPWVYTSESCPFYQLTNDLLAETCCEPRKVAWVDSEPAVRELVQAEAGISMLRKDDAERMRDSGHVHIMDRWKPEIALGFAVNARRKEEPLLQAAVKIVSGLWGIRGHEDAVAT